MKTEKQIERDFFNFVKNSDLATKITGKVYRNGMRPISSDKEDVIVKFLAGLDLQVQSGVVVVNIYVPDISISNRDVENMTRIGELQEALLSFIRDNKNSEYLIETDVTPKTLEAKDIGQHFIYSRLKFKRLAL